MELKKQKIYKTVYEMACRDILNSDCEAKFVKAGVTYEKAHNRFTVRIPYFDEMITLEIPDFSFKSSKSTNITLVTKIILLHYINTASGALPGAEKISYKDIPGAGGYLPVFERRTSKPLSTAFGFDRHAFLETGISLGGKAEEYGDASFTIYAFPKVPITFILWEGDEEFHPSVKTLFDPSVTGYLPIEDITVITKLASTRIIKEARLKYAGN